MSHKHCVFCGEEVPVPRPTSWSDVCESSANTLAPDTVGNRHHVFLLSKTEKLYTNAKLATTPKKGSPTIGALLDAWDGTPNDFKSDLLDQ